MAKSWFPLFWVSIFFSTFAFAQEPLKPLSLGVDVDQPYILAVGSSTARSRANVNVGLDARHWFLTDMNYGLRFYFDGEKQGGSIRQYVLAPGYAYHWMKDETWRPFFRFDLPVVLKGAFNRSGSDSKKDMGISAGTGFVWKLGDAIGIDHMEFRYNFAVSYLFGLGSANSVVSLDLFRAGFDYHF